MSAGRSAARDATWRGGVAASADRGRLPHHRGEGVAHWPEIRPGDPGDVDSTRPDDVDRELVAQALHLLRRQAEQREHAALPEEALVIAGRAGGAKTVAQRLPVGGDAAAHRRHLALPAGAELRIGE